MNSIDILKLHLYDYQNFDLDFQSIKTFEKNGEYKRAGEKCRLIGKNLLTKNLNVHAIEFYSQASDFFIKSSNYLRAISSELTVYQIYRLTNNLSGMANAYEKVASFYKYYLEKDTTAGTYYFYSAKHHEENQNYFTAFKKAKFASECLENSDNKELTRNAYSLAFRMALKSGFSEKAGIYAQMWLKLTPKDYSSHYVSICQKAYRGFSNAGIIDKASQYLNEIIIAHYEKNTPQTNIRNYLFEGIKLSIQSPAGVNKNYVYRVMTDIGLSHQEYLHFLIQMKMFANTEGRDQDADYFYTLEMEYRRITYYNQRNFIASSVYWLWKKTSSYGLSVYRWFISSIAIMFLFGLAYSPLPIYVDQTNFLYKIGSLIKPSISHPDNFTGFSPFYYSVVTFATLGYGDITPTDIAGQITCIAEVLLGYIMLGVLLTIFAKKLSR